jgi:hypothetical protein
MKIVTIIEVIFILFKTHKDNKNKSFFFFILYRNQIALKINLTFKLNISSN